MDKNNLEQDTINKVVLGSADPLNKPVKNTAAPLAPQPQKSRRPLAIATLVIGIITLIVGIIMLILNLTARPAVPDADFLIAKRTWAITDTPAVEWTFTEVGKGTLTTNSHTNDYNFLWAIDGDQLTIETDWLYTLDNTFTYKLDQSTATLTLTASDGTTYAFAPLPTNPSDSE